MAQLQEVLKKLIEDEKYREAVARDPHQLKRDYQNLDAGEMLALMQVWLHSGHPDAALRLSDLCHCCCGHS